MAIYGFGAFHGNRDVSSDFINKNVIGTGWSFTDSPELFQYIKSLKVGDIVYIKSFSPSSTNLFIKGIVIIKDDNIVVGVCGITCGRNVIWKDKTQFTIPKPIEKNNVRANTMYEEFNPSVQECIISKL